MGSNISCRNVHTGQRQGKGPGPYCSIPFPVPVPSPFPCSVTKPFRGLSEVPVSSYVTKLYMRPNTVTKEGVSGTKHFYWVPLYGTTVFFIDLGRIPVTPKGLCWKSTRQQGRRVNLHNIQVSLPHFGMAVNSTFSPTHSLPSFGVAEC